MTFGLQDVQLFLTNAVEPFKAHCEELKTGTFIMLFFSFNVICADFSHINPFLI